MLQLEPTIVGSSCNQREHLYYIIRPLSATVMLIILFVGNKVNFWEKLSYKIELMDVLNRLQGSSSSTLLKE